METMNRGIGRRNNTGTDLVHLSFDLAVAERITARAFSFGVATRADLRSLGLGVVGALGLGITAALGLGSTLHSPICSAGFQWTSSGLPMDILDIHWTFHPIFTQFLSTGSPVEVKLCPVAVQYHPNNKVSRHPLVVWSTGCPRGLLDHPGWTSTGCLFDYPGSATGGAPLQKSGHGKLWLCYFDI